MPPRIRPARFGRPRVGPPKPKMVAKIRRTKAQAYTHNWDAISKAIRRRDGNKCCDCGSTKGLEVHHIIPVSKGGQTVSWNLKTLCWRCHNARHSHLH